MSTRPAAASIFGVNDAVTPPCRMNVPSCTVRTRSTFGLYVIVKVITETRDALLIETGTVYGPPATRNSVPGGNTLICAGVAGVVGVVPGAGGVPGGDRGGATGAGATGSGVMGGVPAGGVPGGVAIGGMPGGGGDGCTAPGPPRAIAARPGGGPRRPGPIPRPPPG